MFGVETAGAEAAGAAMAPAELLTAAPEYVEDDTADRCIEADEASNPELTGA